MKVEIMYTTLCKATVFETNGDSWTYDPIFKNLQSAIEWAEFQIEAHPISFEISAIVITDTETGEVLAECTPNAEEEDCDCDWGFNEDEGFDPYMGCYSDDC